MAEEARLPRARTLRTPICVLAALLTTGGAAQAATVCESGCDFTTIAEAIAAGEQNLQLGAGDHDGGVLNFPTYTFTITGAGKDLTRIKCVGNQQKWTVPNIVGPSYKFEDLTLEACQTPLLTGVGQNSVSYTRVRVEAKVGPVSSSGSAGGYSVSITDSEFVPWPGQSSISGHYVTSNGRLTVRGSTFIGGRGSSGGAVRAGRSATIEDSLFIDNRATSLGGAVYQGAHNSYSSELKLSNSRFCANRAPNGAAVYAISTTAVNSVQGNLFIGNEITSGGTGTVTITASSSRQPTVNFRNNTIVGGTGGDGLGLHLMKAATVDFRNNAFGGNSGSSLLSFALSPLSLEVVANANTDEIPAVEPSELDNGEWVDGEPLWVDPPPYDFSGPDWEDCDADLRFLTGSSLDEAGVPVSGSDPVDIGAFGLALGLDRDGDGSQVPDDCDDLDPFSYPGAEERCDGADNDCDGIIDGPDPVDGDTFYEDADGDAFGDEQYFVVACERPEGTSATPGDCDDDAPHVNPDATEVCSGVDDDCDGKIDDADPGLDPNSATAWYPDTDGDSYGEGEAPELACEQPDGKVANGDDCGDDAAVNPSAVEVCNLIDDDCDGKVDDADPSRDASTTRLWYRDVDGDSYGDPQSSVAACAPPEGYVEEPSDCDDGAPSVHVGAEEVCNGIDDDCDEQIDDADDDLELESTSAWHRDADGDGLGDPASLLRACEAPEGYVARADDCDDTVADPSNTVADADTWYLDDDGDGFGDPTEALQACEAPSDYVIEGTDCRDDDPLVHPDAAEICNETDDNCSGLIDDEDPDRVGAPSWYLDGDGDGYGDPDEVVLVCEPPPDFIAADGDCDDGNAERSPTATEVCNGVDDDCDGLVDDADPSLDLGTADTWFVDDDGDGSGDPSATLLACELPDGASAEGDDCDDARAFVHPGATEVPGSGIDEDCDGVSLFNSLGGGAVCGCASTDRGAGWWLALFAVAWRRRRT